jgi:hypothetical protein
MRKRCPSAWPHASQIKIPFSSSFLYFCYLVALNVLRRGAWIKKNPRILRHQNQTEVSIWFQIRPPYPLGTYYLCTQLQQFRKFTLPAKLLSINLTYYKITWSRMPYEWLYNYNRCPRHKHRVFKYVIMKISVFSDVTVFGHLVW